MTEERPITQHAMTLVVMAQNEAGDWTEVKRQETNGVDFIPVTSNWPPCQCPSPTCPDRRRR